MSPLHTRSQWSFLISFSRREGSPGYMVEPPERTMCLYRSGRVLMSHDWMQSKTSSARPLLSTSIIVGWKSASGASKRSGPT